jgi:hypothetical protein
MKDKFTKLPLEAFNNGSYFDVRTKEGLSTASVFENPFLGIGKEEQEANAKLYAASNELYDIMNISRIVMRDAYSDICNLGAEDSIIGIRMKNAIRIMTNALSHARGEA